MSMKRVAGAVLIGLLSGAPAGAATLYANNGHYYDFVPGDVSWDGALAAAAAAAAAPMAGHAAHLVTIADAGEDAFVKGLVGGAAQVWAAGSDAATDGDWRWAAGPQAGRAFYGPNALPGSYTNWNVFEPNNLGGETALQVHAFDGNWNDAAASFSPAGGYVVEYSPIPAAPSLYAANGHLYQFIQENGSWDLALASAALAPAIPGYDAYLATITDAGEDAFIRGVLGDNGYVWAAGTDAGAEGVWRWAAGPESGQIFYGPGADPGAYSHWNPFEPNNLGGENSLQIHSFGDNWNDAPADFLVRGYVVEYSRSAVPEPATWTMAILGLAATGAALRRRRLALA